MHLKLSVAKLTRSKRSTHQARVAPQLDFAVIVMGWLPYLIPSLGQVSAIRCARALRPLRTIQKLPGLKKQAPHSNTDRGAETAP